MKPKCIICQAEFENTTRVSKEKYLKRKYCSRGCANRDTIEKRFTPEMKKNLSTAMTGKFKSETHKANISKALKTSEKAKRTQFKKGSENPAYGRNQTGSANANWKGGKTSSNQKKRNDPRMKEWRQAVFERDNFTCQDCGVKGYLQAHHLVPISRDLDKAFNIENGKTVCVECHEKIHGRFIGKFKQKT
jgi:hypothetical protein